MNGIPDIDRTVPVQQTESVIGAPPPPSEVKIRTMHSDIAGMAESGGGLPHFQSVKVAGLSLGDTPHTPTAAHKSRALVMVFITLVAMIVLVALFYFGYQLLAVPK